MAIDTLVTRASDVTSEDVDRIRAIEDLLLDATTDSQKAAVADTLAQIVKNPDDDYLVRQIASRDIGFYPEPNGADGLLRVLLDSEDDLDVRTNLLRALRRWKSSAVQTLRSRIASTDPLRPSLDLALADTPPNQALAPDAG